MNDIFAMSEEQTFVRSILTDIEACEKPFTEAEINKYLLEHLYTLPPDISEKDDKALKYEILAFSFTWDNTTGSSHSAPRFAPPDTGADERRFTELKSGDITDDVLRYWSGRAKETKNPMMKARYADLVWSFSRNLGKPADPEMARAAVDSILEMAKTKYYPSDEYITSRLKRALSLSLGVKDFNRFGKTIDIMFLIEGSITDIPDYYLDVIDSIRSATG
ncbi:MAG: hypothetical protein A2W19_16385 [Spirochaetes bacterium RBG_16_49_21]|nr:MAG: hypothetical protein A2W19_16385 [Spirochaetes bacterium RBG_16_49_21]